jgi:hypothetical protein
MSRMLSCIYMHLDLVIARFSNLLFGVILSKVEDTFFFNSSPCKSYIFKTACATLKMGIYIGCYFVAFIINRGKTIFKIDGR